MVLNNKLNNISVLSAKQNFKEELASYYPYNEVQSMMCLVFNHLFKLSKTDLIVKEDNILSDNQVSALYKVIKQLKTYKPLAYIFGEWEFYGLKIKVNENTLIPRPETEELVNLILEENNNRASLLDIGTGSGCIAIALKKNQPDLNVFAIDVSKEALQLAVYNASNNNTDIIFDAYDILKFRDIKLENKFDIIVSNPPYIPIKDKNIMHENVLNYEPHVALFVHNNNPLLFYKEIMDFAKIYLNKKGVLYFEIHEMYGQQVLELAEKKGFINVKIIKDINDKDRILKAQINQ